MKYNFYMFNWGYVGSGKIAHNTANAINNKNKNKIYAVYSRNINHAQSFAKTFKCKVYQKVDDLIKDRKVDCVYIGTTNETHFPLVKKCLLAHKSVLCEKPITLNAKECAKLIKIAKKEKVYFAEAMWTWFNPTSLKVKELIKKKVLGKIVSVTGTFNQILLSKEKFIKRLADINLGGGSLLDLGVYPIRYTYELFGYPKKIICKAKMKYQVDITDYVTLKYPGFSSKIMSSSNDPYFDNFLIKGEKGFIEIKNFHAAHQILLVVNKKEKIINFDKKINPYLYQFNSVKNDIIKHKLESKFVPLSSSLDVMKIMDECRKQIGLIFPQEK